MNNGEIKVGDRVVIRAYDDMIADKDVRKVYENMIALYSDGDPSTYGFTDGMKYLCGKEYVVTYISPGGTNDIIELNTKGTEWHFHPWMLDPACNVELPDIESDNEIDLLF